MVLTANRAEVRIRNNRYIQHAEAVGRTVRLMTRAPPSSVETLVVTSVENRMPTSSLTFRRSDVERLENTEVSQVANAAVMTDAQSAPCRFGAKPWRHAPFSMVAAAFMAEACSGHGSVSKTAIYPRLA